MEHHAERDRVFEHDGDSNAEQWGFRVTKGARSPIEVHEVNALLNCDALHESENEKERDGEYDEASGRGVGGGTDAGEGLAHAFGEHGAREQERDLDVA